MSYEKPFNTILQEIITDYNNMMPDRDTSQGSDTFIDASCLTAALWGVYKFASYVRDQISPLTCDSDWLTRHAALYGITRISGETDTDLLARLMSRLQHPPAGGNRYDYVAWAKEVEVTHTAAWAAATEIATYDVVCVDVSGTDWLFMCISGGTTGGSAPSWDVTPGSQTVDNTVVWQVWEAGTFIERASTVDFFRHQRGMGSIDLIVQNNYEQIGSNEFLTGVPSNLLLSDILAYIDEKGPVNAWDYEVKRPELVNTQVIVTFPSGETTQAQRDNIQGDIVALMCGLGVGETLYQSALQAICVNNGAPGISSIVPSENVECYPDGEHPMDFQLLSPYDSSGDAIVTVGEA